MTDEFQIYTPESREDKET